MGMMELPPYLVDILERRHARISYDFISWKVTIRHSGMTETEKKRLQLWYGMNAPYELEFVEEAE